MVYTQRIFLMLLVFLLCSREAPTGMQRNFIAVVPMRNQMRQNKWRQFIYISVYVTWLVRNNFLPLSKQIKNGLLENEKSSVNTFVIFYTYANGSLLI